jgi:hypothetical protein
MSKLQNRKPKPNKNMEIWHIQVKAYTCKNCQTQFREYYDKNGKYSFTLKIQKGKGYIKV